MLILEICVDSLNSAKAAIDGGAGRLEVCSALELGGLTPSMGLLSSIKKYCYRKKKQVSIFAMIRVRPGDFDYNLDEINQMKEEIIWIKKNKLADGFVFGLLLNEKEFCKLDEVNLEILVKLAKPFPVTFHRAFDLCSNPLEVCSKLIQLGFDRILTSGQVKTAEAGLELIQACVKSSGSCIKIMPGSGINSENVVKIIKIGQVQEIHSSASKERVSSAAAVIEPIFVQGVAKWRETDTQTVKQLMDILNEQ